MTNLLSLSLTSVCNYSTLRCLLRSPRLPSHAVGIFRSFDIDSGLGWSCLVKVASSRSHCILFTLLNIHLSTSYLTPSGFIQYSLPIPAIFNLCNSRCASMCCFPVLVLSISHISDSGSPKTPLDRLGCRLVSAVICLFCLFFLASPNCPLG